jgi:hypothetical protein
MIFEPSLDRLDVSEFGRAAALSRSNRWQDRNPPPALQEAAPQESRYDAFPQKWSQVLILPGSPAHRPRLPAATKR